METITRLDRKGRTLYIQKFNGREYVKYPKERYFKNGATTTWLHRAVWEYYNGCIPKGYHVHHKNENVFDNEIDNLELLEAHQHLSMHTQEKMQNAEYIEQLQKKMDYARGFASKWHGSEEGKEWHRLHGIEVANNLSTQEYKCMYCGKTYQAKPIGNHKFCSNACKTRYRYHSKVDNEERTCKYCGAKFSVNKYLKKEYCSNKCYWEDRRAKNKEDKDS